ncbi:Aspartokinase [Modicella reniformis]|uniref:aspartate kinase n=1 Tax=Modicella reniformis TaxID=1440133 RepID=A0A9P6IHX8_9FUNG|nr:Aspartokinase [Modicella reniformis]
MNPQGAGTIIFPDQPSGMCALKRNTPPPSSKVLLENGYQLDLSRRHPTAVTIKDNVWVLNIHSNRKSVSHGFFEQIFSTLDRYGIAVDLISTSEVHISMALSVNVIEAEMEKAIEGLRLIGTVSVSKDMAILSLVGKQMKNMVGISGRMFSTLAKAGINIEMISQGASEINISCVILERQAIQALNVIHTELLSNVAEEDEDTTAKMTTTDDDDTDKESKKKHDHHAKDREGMLQCALARRSEELHDLSQAFEEALTGKKPLDPPTGCSVAVQRAWVHSSDAHDYRDRLEVLIDEAEARLEKLEERL